MLQIVVNASEVFDESISEFVETEECVLNLEHSLLSISKWESKWHKPFIPPDANNKNYHSTEEILDYIKCMTLNKNVDPNIYLVLSKKNILDVNLYISDPMTATTVRDTSSSPLRHGVVTSEVIYYYMITFGIPIECEKWHINRLLMLIKVCAAKNNPQKMSHSAILAQNRELNEARKKALKTRG